VEDILVAVNGEALASWARAQGLGQGPAQGPLRDRAEGPWEGGYAEGITNFRYDTYRCLP